MLNKTEVHKKEENDEKAALSCLSSISRDAVEKYHTENGHNIPYYLVVFDNEKNRFYGINSVRFLERKLYSFQYLDKRETLNIRNIYNSYTYHIRNRREQRDSRNLDKYITIINMSDFYKKYPESCCIEACEKSGHNDLLSTLLYAVCYCDNPSIKYFVKDGYCDLLFEILYSTMFSFKHNFDKNKSTVSEILKLPEEIVNCLKNETSKVKYIDFYQKMYSKELLSKEELLDLMKTDDLSILLYYESLLSEGHYTYKELRDYLERCRIYQGINYKYSCYYLKDYIETCKKNEIKPEKYPNLLSEEYNKNKLLRIKEKEIEFIKDLEVDYPKRVDFYSEFEYEDNCYKVVIEKNPDIVKKIIEENREINYMYLFNKNNAWFWIINKANGNVQRLIRLVGKKKPLISDNIRFSNDGERIRSFMRKYQKYLDRRTKNAFKNTIY